MDEKTTERIILIIAGILLACAYGLFPIVITYSISLMTFLGSEIPQPFFLVFGLLLIVFTSVVVYLSSPRIKNKQYKLIMKFAFVFALAAGVIMIIIYQYPLMSELEQVLSNVPHTSTEGLPGPYSTMSKITSIKAGDIAIATGVSIIVAFIINLLIFLKMGNPAKTK